NIFMLKYILYILFLIKIQFIKGRRIMDKEKIIENLIHAEKNIIQINFFKEIEKLAKSESYQLQNNQLDEKNQIFNSDCECYKISNKSSDSQSIANTYEPDYGRIHDYYIHLNTNQV